MLNPVRARRVRHPQNRAWSSYRATIGRVAAPSWLHADGVLSQLGGRNPAGAYERFVRQGIGEHSPWEKLRGQIWLGSEAFIERMQRRAVNLPLQEVAKRGKVSPSRISKIQRAIETGKVPATLRQLLHKCKVKN